MAFGFSPGDIVQVLNFSWNLYKGWDSAFGEYTDVTSQVRNFNVVLRRLKSEVRKDAKVICPSTVHARELRVLMDGCHGTLNKFSGVLQSYESLGLSKSRRTNWDRIRFGTKAKDLDRITEKLVAHSVAIDSYLAIANASSLARVEKGIQDLPRRMQRIMKRSAAKHRASIRAESVLSTHEEDNKTVWKAFRTDLIANNISSEDIKRYKTQIKAHILHLKGAGLLEEEPSDLVYSDKSARQRHRGSRRGARLASGDAPCDIGRAPPP